MSITYAHTNIVSEDCEALARFYQEALGCRPIGASAEKSGEWIERGTGVHGATLKGIHLQLPGSGRDGPTLEIFEFDAHEDRGTPSANRLGFGHIAFLVDDVEETRVRMLAAGGRELGAVTKHVFPDGRSLTFVYLTDPEGNIVEILRRTERSASS